MSILQKLAEAFRIKDDPEPETVESGWLINSNDKDEFDWRQSGVSFNITRVTIDHKWYIPGKDSDNYPYITVQESTMTDEPEAQLLADGWIDGGYDRYNGIYRYHKTVDIRSIVDSICLGFEKKTDERDQETFGFDMPYAVGNYHYPVPEYLKEEVALMLYDSRNMSYVYYGPEVQEPLRSELLRCFKDSILNDEYYALCEFKEKHKKALFEAIDPNLSEDEQKYAFKAASRAVEVTSPARDRYGDGRFGKVIKMNYALAYEKAHIAQNNSRRR